SFAELGQWSRRRHASQGMGHWSDAPQRVWELHLKRGGAEAALPESALAESVPATLGALAGLAGAAAGQISDAAAAIATAQAAFPDRAAIIAALARADTALEAAQAR